MRQQPLFCIFLLSFIAISGYSQQKSNRVYEVKIYSWSKTENKEALIKIDSSGQIFLNNENTNQKVNIKLFTKSVNEFVQAKSLAKIKANNDPPPSVEYLNNPAYTVSVSITYLADYYKEKDFYTKSHYEWEYAGADKEEGHLFINKFLDKPDQLILKKLLD
jgi:hypothetical protein